MGDAERATLLSSRSVLDLFVVMNGLSTLQHTESNSL